MVFYSKNKDKSSCSKHIDIKYLVVRDKIKEVQTIIDHISTKATISDPIWVCEHGYYI